MELKNLDLSKPNFQANGKTYFWSKDISMDHFIEFEKAQLEVAIDLSFDGMFNMLKKLYGLVNEQKFADTAVEIYNNMNRVKDGIEKRIHPMYRLICLFVYEKDEDKRYYSREREEEKISDLKEEGYSANSLFQVAFNLIPNFIKTYQGVSADILQTMEKELKKEEKISRNKRTK